MSVVRSGAAAWRSLRVRLAVAGFAAIYVPVLLVFGVTQAAEVERTDTGGDVVTDSSTERTWWATATVLALAPGAAALAWWWAGRAVAPIDRVRAVAEDIEASDLGRRIALERGPAEVVALAASFDAMLDRLERAADVQRGLVEETSHELRTPLAVLATNAEVLLAQPDATVDDYRQGLVRSQSAAARLRATIDDLLVDARGRARTLARRPADVVAIVAGAVDEARVLAAARGVEVDLAGPPALAAAVDETTFRRAVTNLLDNAVRHAPTGSTVSVDVTTGEDADGHDVAVTVTDRGPGIPPTQLGHVFERFWRGDGEGRGTGLGLPIARQVALAHGGDVTVTSPGPAGDGTVVRLTVRRSHA